MVFPYGFKSRFSHQSHCFAVAFLFPTDLEWFPFPSRRASLRVKINRCYFISAGMAELVDALDSGSSDFTVIQVQVLLPAPPKSLENTEFSRLFAFYFPLSHGFQGMHRLWRCVCRFSVRFYTLSGNITLDPMITWI